MTAPRRPPFYAIGVSAGLLLGLSAFLYGAQHPSDTLPATPVITPEPVLAAQAAPML